MQHVPRSGYHGHIVVPSMTRNSALRAVLSPWDDGDKIRLFLPTFRDGNVDVPGFVQLEYPGGLFSARDTRAAIEVAAFLIQTVSPDDIVVRYADDYFDSAQHSPLSFVFGSRSNELTHHLMTASNASRLFELEYGDVWRLVWHDGLVCELSNPSRLAAGQYARVPDYGVVAKVSDPVYGRRAILIAGLGSRGTEGSALYLRKNWQHIQDEFNQHDFALLLQFEPESASAQLLRSGQLETN